MNTPSSESFTGLTGFVLAASGGAIGLGNVWRFAYVAGENGGAAFLLVYVACVVLIALPVLLAEFVLGSRARGDVVGAFRHPRVAGAWQGVGWLAALVAFLILSYYAVIAGWACRYFYAYLSGGMARVAPGEVAETFRTFVAHPWQSVAWHGLFMALTAVVVAAGVTRGIERLCRLLMPALAVVVVLLAGYAVSLPGAGEGLRFLFAPDWSALTHPRLYLAALGQAFFSIGVAMGVMVTYAAYIRSRERLGLAALAVVAGDTLFAIVAGVAVFPIVFAFGLDPAYGPALAFVTLPQVLAVMPGGLWVAIAFFFLLSAAALTSAVSLLEVPAAIAMQRGWTRKKAATVIGVCAFLAGVPSALGSGALAHVRIAGRAILDAVDHLAADVLLPLVGIGVVLFAAWVLPRAAVLDGCGLPRGIAHAWYATLRYLAPMAMFVFLLTALS